MKTSELKKLIKESVREAIKEELKDILLEAVKSNKSQPILTEQQTFKNNGVIDNPIPALSQYQHVSCCLAHPSEDVVIP